MGCIDKKAKENKRLDKPEALMDEPFICSIKCKNDSESVQYIGIQQNKPDSFDMKALAAGNHQLASELEATEEELVSIQQRSRS